ncbi:MAG: hypothetical protein CBD58_00365 [bacterium TMED198]|nr:MAG: hypothetical protein CBD58_00365 [bacterium TMED198]
MTTILSFLFVIGVLVFVHELGHYLAARSVGVRVEKFYLGFNFFGLGINKTYKGTEYGLGLFPFGGYVKLAGAIDESMDTSSTGAPDELRSKNALEKIWVMSAGVIMNFLLAIIIFSLSHFSTGEKIIGEEAIVSGVVPTFPADSIGIVENDKILSIDGNKFNGKDAWNKMSTYISSSPGKDVEIIWESNGVLKQSRIIIDSYSDIVDYEFINIGRIGIFPITTTSEINLFRAFKLGFETTKFWFDKTLGSFICLVKGTVPLSGLGGPIMIAKVSGQASEIGFGALLNLMAILSINLGIINIMPLPALDGGHVLISAVEGLRRKELSTKFKLNFQKVGAILLMVLIIFVVYNDLANL